MCGFGFDLYRVSITQVWGFVSGVVCYPPYTTCSRGRRNTTLLRFDVQEETEGLKEAVGLEVNGHLIGPTSRKIADEREGTE